MFWKKNGRIRSQWRQHCPCPLVPTARNDRPRDHWISVIPGWCSKYSVNWVDLNAKLGFYVNLRPTSHQIQRMNCRALGGLSIYVNESCDRFDLKLPERWASLLPCDYFSSCSAVKVCAELNFVSCLNMFTAKLICQLHARRWIICMHNWITWLPVSKVTARNFVFFPLKFESESNGLKLNAFGFDEWPPSNGSFCTHWGQGPRRNSLNRSQMRS